MKQKKEKSEYTLAELTKGLDVRVRADSDYVIKGVCTIHHAKPNHITFLTNPLYKKYLNTTQAGAVILTEQDAMEYAGNAVISSNPYFTYAQIARFFDRRHNPFVGIHPTVRVGQGCEIHETANIAPNCVLGDNVKIASQVTIGPGCYIGDGCEIDEETCLDANVTLYHAVMLGKRVIVASGTVIGSDGFGIAKNKGKWHKVPQLGRVIIKDDVEIGSNCSIDRGAIEDTVIEAGVKLDNLIQVGHNVFIGENTAIAGCVGIAGSAVIGKNCLIGGSTGINGHITIADNVVITGMTMTTKSIREPGVYSSGVGGVVTNLEWRKNTARLHKLDSLIQRVKELESVLKKLTTES